MAENSSCSSDRVTTVIPTVGRASLAAAVRSARAQTGVDNELIVVCDTPDVPPTVRQLDGLVDRVVCTGGGRRAAHARNRGVACATGSYVAFLDDDDEWLPAKLELQVRAATTVQESGYRPIISSRFFQRRAGGLPSDRSVPTRTLVEHQRPEDYLFRRRLVGPGRRPAHGHPVDDT